jgi:hypothetical protein
VITSDRALFHGMFQVCMPHGSWSWLLVVVEAFERSRLSVLSISLYSARMPFMQQDTVV